MMASIYRQYENSNSTVLTNSLLRGEFLYGLKFYYVQKKFMNEQGAVLRMRISLACIEAGAVVIDAYIQIDGTIAYLFVLCSSFLAQPAFSAAVKKILPQVVIEKLYQNQAEIYLTACSEADLIKNKISFVPQGEIASESKNLLISLLIEYKVMLLENKKSGLLAKCLHSGKKGLLAEASEKRKYRTADLNFDIVMFQKDGRILSMPDFQIKKIDKDVFQQKYIQIFPEYGGQKIYIEDIFLLKRIDLSKTVFIKKLEKGIYEAKIQGNTGKITLNFFVPALQK